jgi:hypothetical protein
MLTGPRPPLLREEEIGHSSAIPTAPTRSEYLNKEVNI